MLLDVRGLEAGYGASQVLFGPSLVVGESEVATLLGRNGMARRPRRFAACPACLKPTSGEIRGRAHRRRAAACNRPRWASGCPEGRHIFPNLSVRENRHGGDPPAGAHATRPGRWSACSTSSASCRTSLPTAAIKLSGGEQQMLAIDARLMTNPDLRAGRGDGRPCADHPPADLEEARRPWRPVSR